MDRTTTHAGTRTSQAVRTLRRLVANQGRIHRRTYEVDPATGRGRWIKTDPDSFGAHVELPALAWPGGYEMMYVGHDGDYPICQSCAQRDLEQLGEWPDGYDYVAGGPVDYGGRRTILCNGCGEPIATFDE